MHFNTCNKLIESVRILERELEEVKNSLQREKTEIAVRSCGRLQEEFQILKTAIKEGRTR